MQSGLNASSIRSSGMEFCAQLARANLFAFWAVYCMGGRLVAKGSTLNLRDLHPTLMRFVYLDHQLHFPLPIYNGLAAISFTVRLGATACT